MKSFLTHMLQHPNVTYCVIFVLMLLWTWGVMEWDEISAWLENKWLLLMED